MRSIFIVAVSAALLSVGLGCGGSEPEPEVAPQPTSSVGQIPPPATAPTAETPPPAPAPVVAEPAACDAVQTLAMTTMFQGRQKTELAGLQAEGTPMCSTVSEGQTATSTTFMLQPGRCYGVLGQALPNVTAIEMRLEADVANSGLPPALAALAGNPLLATGQNSGVQSTIGAKPSGCYTWPWPVAAAAKIVIKSTAGSGVVAAQLYSKKK